MKKLYTFTILALIVAGIIPLLFYRIAPPGVPTVESSVAVGWQGKGEIIYNET